MEKVEDEIVAGGWRCLCIGIMVNAVQQVESNSKIFRVGSHRIGRASGTDKEALSQRKQARDWLDGGVGLVTFEDCCAAMNVHPERARKAILERAHKKRRHRDITEVRAAW